MARTAAAACHQSGRCCKTTPMAVAKIASRIVKMRFFWLGQVVFAIAATRNGRTAPMTRAYVKVMMDCSLEVGFDDGQAAFDVCGVCSLLGPDGRAGTADRVRARNWRGLGGSLGFGFSALGLDGGTRGK